MLYRTFFGVVNWFRALYGYSNKRSQKYLVCLEQVWIALPAQFTSGHVVHVGVVGCYIRVRVFRDNHPGFPGNSFPQLLIQASESP